MLISVWVIWASEPNGGGGRGSERCLMLGDKHRHTQTNKYTFQLVSWPADVLSAHTDTQTNTHMI